ncbi:GNAT family N-acetyltransferase [Roseobacteraceae bacterium S113]
MADFEIKNAQSEADLAAAGELMQAYKVSLGLEVFDNPTQKLDEVLPGPYGAKDAGILLAWRNGAPVGVVAFKGLGAGTSEMKRLFVAPDGRGLGLGRALAQAVMKSARTAGHERMVLDTLPQLAAACALYESLGFTFIPRYNDNPVEGVVFYGVDL